MTQSIKRPAKGYSRRKSLISKIRTTTGLSETEFAKATGIKRTTYRALAKGKLKKLHKNHLRQIQLATGADMEVSTVEPLKAYKHPGYFNNESYRRWEEVLDLSKKWKDHLAEKERINLTAFFEVAESSGKLWMAHLLVELALTEIAVDLGLAESISYSEKHDDRIRELGSNLATEHRVEKFLDECLQKLKRSYQ